MISIVVPVYNEEKTAPLLLARLKEEGKKWGDHEIFFIDDGSFDTTAKIIGDAAASDKTLRLISFSRNFGHQAAVSAGLEHAKGDAVVVIDGDLQDPPELIVEFIKKWREGYKVIYAVRKNRKENVIKKFFYALFYRLLKSISKIDIPLDAGDFSLMDREVIDIVVSLREKNRFVRGLRSWAGFSSVGVPYERQVRAGGETKYSLRKLIHLAVDGFTGFSSFPLKISEYLGFGVAFLSFIAGITVFVLKLTVGVDVQGWTSLAIIVFFVGGVQLFLMGVMGEYIARIYTEVQNRPVYIIKKKIGFE